MGQRRLVRGCGAGSEERRRPFSGTCERLQCVQRGLTGSKPLDKLQGTST